MQPAKSDSFLSSMIIMGLLYFVMGFFTWINGPLITFVGLAFELDEVNAFLVLMVFYLSYFFLALPASWLLRMTGMKRGISIAIFVLSLGAFCFGEFATARSYPGALFGLFIIGGGLSMLQTAVNPYVSILGPIDSAARRIAIMGICNKFAGMVAPLVLGAFVLKGLGDLDAAVKMAAPSEKQVLLDAFASQIRGPYLVMAAVLAVVAIAIFRSSLPDVGGRRSSDVKGERQGSIFGFPQLWLGVLCLFLYVGAEVMAGDAIGTYATSFGLPLDQAKFMTSLTLAAMLAGYIVGIVVVPRFFSQHRYLGYCAILGMLLTAAAFLTSGYLSVICVALLGFANAMMWPAIFPLSIKGLGRFTETGSGLLIMGIAGGAVLPQMFAVLKQSFDFQAVFFALMLPCYAFILFFARYCSAREREQLGQESLPEADWERSA